MKKQKEALVPIAKQRYLRVLVGSNCANSACSNTMLWPRIWLVVERDKTKFQRIYAGVAEHMAELFGKDRVRIAAFIPFWMVGVSKGAKNPQPQSHWSGALVLFRITQRKSRLSQPLQLVCKEPPHCQSPHLIEEYLSLQLSFGSIN